ncbi:TPA: hypothetical protein ACGFXW_000009 [Vibrio cholerae]|uniref:hypothetical protein n=1 Tax=Vibrio cholerae TaxID=666 RepID=UPI001E5CC58D|nr:hypothetical protein [Vibrio cholerae]
MKFKKNNSRLNVLSSGGGTQSNATICLIHDGKLPKPDLIVMADTEREMPNVFDYQRKYIQPLCDDMGIEYHIIKKSDVTDWDLYDKRGEPLVGFFTELNGRKENGDCNKKPAYCSGKWKTEVTRKFLNERYPKEVKRGVDSWIGYTIDELRRVRTPVGKWQSRYPLIELRMTRNDCISYVESFGLPTPPKSACWMCPNRPNHEWEIVKREQPHVFEMACRFEREIQEEHPHLWIHQSGVPLSDVDFRSLKDGQIDLFCDNGVCFV